MKKIFLTFLTIIFFYCTSKKEETNIIHLKLREVNNFGSFKKSFSMLLKSSSEKAEKESKGIPKDWKEFYIKRIWIDAFQVVYQDFIKKNLDESKFNDKYKTWIKNPNQRKLSKKSINSYVNIIFRENKNGEVEYILDTNNNKDFSDEEIRIPLKVSDNFNYSISAKKSPFVDYQLSTNNGILKEKVKVLVLLNSNKDLMYGFPQIFETSFLNRKIQVSHGFSNVTFDEKSVFMIENKKEEINIHEIVKIDDFMYKNLGVNINTKTLILERIPRDKELFSTNVGFKAIPFKIKKMNSKDSISILNYRGKFIYIDFWGTWCAPCLMEIPTIEYAYEETSRSDIEFLGIAVHDTKEKVKSFNLIYPQFLESDSKNLKEKYNIIKYPTTFLIDRKGKIVAKDLKGEKLLDTLNFYIKNYKN
ncbi:thiol-disulfide isomerase/thioredoxin [Lutibacter sp. Hel_I_33_5]|uniref:TlpA family protein disulfide reductase n=1 Tax=Lutibacter sp. Hel_I_33_5 TaxID=1566289 RepID=UPI00119DE3C6|nr:TlpA disulfide reductase family protein [Lutibacter sp. Hel_I_33_5]TVZ55683.1 thiol-disulfide isomerase/thioredoxin [Lutibacter sp. Hel_I_33_5]